MQRAVDHLFKGFELACSSPPADTSKIESPAFRSPESHCSGTFTGSQANASGEVLKSSGNHDDAEKVKAAHAAVIVDTNSTTTISASVSSPSPCSARTIALISGYSGNGKSALAMHFEQQCLQRNGFFVSGKFDLQQMDEPFSGIRTAMLQLCEQIQAMPDFDDDANSVMHAGYDLQHQQGQHYQRPDPRRLSALRKHLNKSLSHDELKILSKILPPIRNIMRPAHEPHQAIASSAASASSPMLLKRQPSGTSMSTTSITMSNNGNELGGYKEQSEGLKFVLRRFIQVICNYCPLVIVADDIQWADQASLDVIQSWIMDNNNTALLIIGCHRLEQDSPALDTMISNLKDSKRERCFRLLQIQVNELKLEDVVQYLNNILLGISSSSIESQEESKTTATEEIHQLAQVIYKKTDGNAFFVQQYLQSLVQHRLMTYNSNAMKWMWDIKTIRSDSPPTTTILDMMKEKLQQSKYARYVLPIAACLGATLSKSTITSIVRALSLHSDHSTFFRKVFEIKELIFHVNEDDMQRAFRKCQREGFILVTERERRRRNHTSARDNNGKRQSDASKNDGSPSDGATMKNMNKSNRSSISSSKQQQRKRRSKRKSDSQDVYKFAHDKIQEAALALIPSEHLSELKYRVGEVLLSILTGDDMDEKVFVVSSLLNGRPDLIPSEKTNSERRKRIIAINHRAGMKAAESSSFGLALEYLQKAMALLPDDHWKTHFRLSLEIYSAAAECAFVIPDMDLMEKYCNTIIDVDCPVLHKMRGYHILMDASSVQETARDSSDPIKLGFSALSQMKCNFPKSTFGQTFKAIAGMIQLKIQSSKWNESTFRELPLVTDEYESTVMKTLDRFNVQLYFERPGLLPMGVLKSFRRTMANGVSTFSPPAFAMVALMVGFILENFKAAELLAESALDMLSRLESRVSESRTIFVVNIGTFHWMRPIRDGKGPLLQAYNSGMITGDVVSALWALFAHYEFSFICGESVDVMEQLLSTCYQESMDQQKDNMANSMLMHSQAIQNIQGISDNTVMIVGDLFDERKYAPKDGEEQSKEDGLLSLGIGGAKIFLAAHFAEYETGAELAVQLVDTLIAQLAGIVFLVLWTSYGGLSCYAAYHQLPSHRAKQRKRYLKMAKHCRKKIKHWYSLGNPNCEHIVAMLDGEELWRRGRIADAIEHYERAIRVARKNQFTHYEAYANERLGDLLYEQHKDGKKNRPKAAKERYNESMMIYAKWGGKRKVEMLRAKIEDLFGGSP